jgi:succinoglycan biosynthesis protein ExoM
MEPPKVAICVATCRRPRWLGQLLESLSKLKFKKCPGVVWTVIVVDNDSKGSAREVAEGFSSRLPGLVYDLEPVQNISLARNKTISLAKSLDCEYVAFVDDDEFVDPDWLDNLLYTMELFNADIVRGPVIPVFPDPAPHWIVKGGFFDRQRYNKTGQIIRCGATNNVLIKRQFLDLLEGPFDVRFGLTGGEDTHLFERLYRLGACMVWSNEAIVRENVAGSRTNLKWILLHAYNFGSKLALCDRALKNPKNWLLPRAFKGIGRIVQGSILLLPSLLFSYASAIKSLTYIARGVGMIAGIFGCKVEEYKRVHGS